MIGYRILDAAEIDADDLLTLRRNAIERAAPAAFAALLVSPAIHYLLPCDPAVADIVSSITFRGVCWTADEIALPLDYDSGDCLHALIHEGRHCFQRRFELAVGHHAEERDAERYARRHCPSRGLCGACRTDFDVMVNVSVEASPRARWIRQPLPELQPIRRPIAMPARTLHVEAG